MSGSDTIIQIPEPPWETLTSTKVSFSCIRPLLVPLVRRLVGNVVREVHRRDADTITNRVLAPTVN